MLEGVELMEEQLAQDCLRTGLFSSFGLLLKLGRKPCYTSKLLPLPLTEDATLKKQDLELDQMIISFRI